MLPISHFNNNFEVLRETLKEDQQNEENWFDDLRPIEEIPHPFQQVFAEYPNFNIIQSKVFDDVFYTDKSMVISAPTGSGKTGIFELAIVRLLLSYQKIGFDFLKIVYISPMKALCEERLVEWHRKFTNFGINCISVTGDSDNVEFQNLLNHNIIITTPEKWDCLTRKWKDNKKLVQVIKLFMIDEIHLLNEEARGPVLETIVCRMKTIEESNFQQGNNDDFSHKIRFIAVSATVANIEDIAEWIGEASNVKYYKFSDQVRPVKLNKIVLGYTYGGPKATPFKFDLTLNYKLQSLIMQYSHGKPTLIFCSTRKIVEMTARHLLQNLTFQLKPPQKQHLIEVSACISDAKIKESVIHGVGYHHAGMLPETKRAVENLFRSGQLPILVTTSTLAMGVNLPAHLVIIKSTKCYANGAFRDYSQVALLQMIGRAGRPQFDTTATALILTTMKDKEKFEKMIGGLEPIESNLHRHLTEHLNAEVVLETITDLDIAMQWLSSTFLYKRAKKNPKFYGLNLESGSEQIDKKLLEMCQIEINKLVKAGMLTIDQNISLKSTSIGALMAKYYLAFETMKLFTQMNGSEILQQILGLISKCQEFSEMYLRVNDKKCLNLLNKCRDRQTIRFPLNGKIKTIDMKINCVIQAVLGCLDICDHSLLTETLKIMRNGERIVKCLIEYLESKRQCFKALLNTIILVKCFHVQLWENSPYISKQLFGIGNVMSSQLVNAGKISFEILSKCDPQEIEMLLNKKSPFGSKILEQIYHLPKYRLRIELCEKQKLDLIITLENALDLQEQSTVNRNSMMYLLVGDSSNNILLYEKYSHSYMIENPDIKRSINFCNDNLEEIEAHFISEDWVGIDCSAKYEFIYKSKAPKNTKIANPTKKKEESLTYMQKFMEMYMQYKSKGQVDIECNNSDNKIIVQSNVAVVPQVEVPTKNLDIDKYKFAPKKLTHKVDLEEVVPAKKLHLSNDEPDNKPRSEPKIKWRSPLVYSPPVKYSPKICYPTKNENSHDLSSSSSTSNAPSSSTWPLMKLKSSRTGSFFPLSDKDCGDSSLLEDSQNNSKIIEQFGNFVSTSFLENVGLIEANVTHKGLINSPSETSAGYYKRLLSQSQKSSSVANITQVNQDKMGDSQSVMVKRDTPQLRRENTTGCYQHLLSQSQRVNNVVNMSQANQDSQRGTVAMDSSQSYPYEEVRREDLTGRYKHLLVQSQKVANMSETNQDKTILPQSYVYDEVGREELMSNSPSPIPCYKPFHANNDSIISMNRTFEARRESSQQISAEPNISDESFGELENINCWTHENDSMIRPSNNRGVCDNIFPPPPLAYPTNSVSGCDSYEYLRRTIEREDNGSFGFYPNRNCCFNGKNCGENPNFYRSRQSRYTQTDYLPNYHPHHPIHNRNFPPFNHNFHPIPTFPNFNQERFNHSQPSYLRGTPNTKNFLMHKYFNGV